MVHGENTTIIRYRILGQGKMRLLPLVHCRNFHAATVLPDIMQELINEGVMLKSNSSFSLLSERAKYVQDMNVYYNFEYDAERRRGLAWRENSFALVTSMSRWREKTHFALWPPQRETPCSTLGPMSMLSTR